MRGGSFIVRFYREISDRKQPGMGGWRKSVIRCCFVKHLGLEKDLRLSETFFCVKNDTDAGNPFGGTGNA